MGDPRAQNQHRTRFRFGEPVPDGFPMFPFCTTQNRKVAHSAQTDPQVFRPSGRLQNGRAAPFPLASTCESRDSRRLAEAELNFGLPLVGGLD